jgi:Mn-dependent DtxR family transcriptional regulator
VSDEFLNKFYQMTSGEYKIFDKYKVGSKLDLSNSQTDDIVDDLHNIGLIKKIGMSKILMTFEGKKDVEESS